MNRQSIIASVIIVVLFVAVCGNWYGTIYFLEPNLEYAISYFIALGLLVAQPYLLSIWCALGSLNAVLRIPFAMGTLTVLTFVYAKVLERDGAPLEAALVISGIALAMTVVLQIPLWIFRAKTKQVIALPVAKSDLGKSQIGIKHLLVVTTFVAALVSLSRFIIPESALVNGAAPWSEIVWGALTFILATTLLSFLAIGFVFIPGRRIGILLTLLVFLVATTFGCLAVMSRLNKYGTTYWDFEAYSFTITFLCANTIAILFVLGIFYLIGYRLTKLR